MDEGVSAHLDTTCPGISQTGSSSPAPPAPTKNKPQMSRPPPDRLPQISYSLFSEQKLRKKLSELGIPAWGNRQLLQRRHAEWLALWNANCDSAEPRSKSALLRELDAWERSQGGRSAQEARVGTQSKGEIMDKDFDGKGWAHKNRPDFDDLIQQARASRAAKKTPTDDRGEAVSEEAPPDATPDTALPHSIENPALNLPAPSANISAADESPVGRSSG